MGWPGPMTDRQFRVWNAWIDGEWNRPSRTDYYLMRLAAEVRRGWVKEPRKVDERDFRIKFEAFSSRPRKATPAQRVAATAAAKLRWHGMMGKPVASTPPTVVVNGGVGGKGLALPPRESNEEEG